MFIRISSLPKSFRGVYLADLLILLPMLLSAPLIGGVDVCLIDDDGRAMEN